MYKKNYILKNNNTYIYMYNFVLYNGNLGWIL